MGVSVKIEDQEVLDAFRRMGRFGTRPEPVLRAMGRYGKSSTQMRFRHQVGPDGRPWKPSTRVLKHGGQTLRMTSRLRNSLAWQLVPGGVEWGTNVKYAAAHQFGMDQKVRVAAHYRAGRRKRKTASGARVSFLVRAHERHMKLPARPFLGINELDRIHLLDIIRVEMLKQAGLPANRFG